MALAQPSPQLLEPFSGSRFRFYAPDSMLPILCLGAFLGSESLDFALKAEPAAVLTSCITCGSPGAGHARVHGP